jgi:hypothetical protein
MLPVQQPDLASMFGQYSVGPTVVGYDRQQMANQNNAFNLQQAAAEEQRNAEKHPIDMKSALQLARQRRLTSDLAEKEQPFKLAEAERKGNIAADEDQAKGLERAGLVFKQAGALAKANGGKIPLQYQQYFHPEMLKVMDSMTPEQMTEHGDAIFKNSKSYLGQEQKNEGRLDVASTNASVKQAAIDAANERSAADRASRERIAAQRIESARKLLNDKRSTASDKKSLEQYAQDLFRQANDIELDDPRAAQIVRARGDDILKKAQSIKAAGAAPRVDLDRNVLEEVGVLPPPRQGTGAAAPTTAPSADPYAGFKIK